MNPHTVFLRLYLFNFKLQNEKKKEIYNVKIIQRF